MTGPVPPADEHGLGRHVFAVGTAEYKDPSWDPLPQVRPDVATVIETLGRFGYTPAAACPTGLIDPPESRDVELPLLRWLRQHLGFEDEVLVIYCAGHGVEEYDHYLICADTEFEPAALKVTALPTARLVELAADAGVQRLLIVVDACYAGDGAADVLAQTAKSHLVSVCASRRDQRKHWKSLAVLSAARSGEEARDGAFAQTLAAVLRRAVEEDRVLAGERPPYIHLSDVVREINRELSLRFLTQRADLAVIHDDGTGFLPNPRHVRGLSEDLDLAEQRVASEQHRLRQKDLVEHFAPRGVGAHGPEETGHYFTGRTSVLTRLAGWLRGDSERDVRLFRVTGGPGTGKSSVLGRLVTRSDPAARHRIPDDTVIVSTDVPPGTIDLSVHAAGKQLTDVLGALADALGASTASTADVLKALTALRRRFTMAIDALDEAAQTGGSSEAIAIDMFLARATYLAPRFRVLAGARPEVFEDIGSSEQVALIDLDDPRWIARRDIVDYSARLLTAPHGQGSSSGLPEELIDRAAQEIGRVAFPNYLVARIVSRALASPEREFWNADPALWASMLPRPLEQAASRRRRSLYGGIGPAFLWARDIQLSPGQTRLYRSVLLPLAYAQGAGLPLPGVWTSLAGLMYGEPITETEIAAVLATDAAAAYVTEAVDAHGRSVYRLYHQALSDNLRSGHVQGMMSYLARQPDSWGVAHSKQAKRLIARAVHQTLLDTVRRTPAGARDWHDADPYLLDHMTAHAAEAQAVDDLLVDCEFLVHANPDSVTPYLQRAQSDDARQAAAVYRASLGRHHRAGPELRRWSLTLDAIRAQEYELADRLRQGALPMLPWPRWTTASPRPGLLRSIDAEASALAVVSDVPMAMTADADGAVRCWNLSDGMSLFGLDAAESGPISDMACVDDDRRTILVTGHTNGDVRIWDLTLDMPHARPLPRDRADDNPLPVTAVDCVALEDRIVVVVTDDDGYVRIWEAEDAGAAEAAEQVACLPPEAVGAARPAVIRLHGVHCLATSRPGGGFSLWSLPGAEPIELTNGGWAEAVAFSALTAPAESDNSVMVAGDADGGIHQWSVTASRSLTSPATTGRRPAGPGARVRTIAATTVDDGAVVVTGHESGHVQFWGPWRDDAIPLVGHHAPLRTVHMARLDTGLAAVTADEAGLVNVWDLEHGTTHVPDSLRVSALAGTHIADRAVAVTGDTDGGIRLWDAVSGRLIRLHPSATSGSEPITALGCAPLPSSPGACVASCHGGYLLQFSDAAAPTATGHRVSVDSLVTALDCAVAGGSAVTVTGHADGSLRLWHFADPEPPVTLLAAGGSPVVAVACAGSADGRPAIAVTRHADGSCLTWDLECRTRSGEALPDERSAVVAVALTPPGPPHATPALAVDGHANGVIVVRDAVKGTPVGPPLAGTSTEARLQSLTCLTGGGHPFVLAGYQDGTLDLFDLIARTLVESTSVSAGVTALSWTPNPPTDGLLTMVAGAELYVLGGGFDG